MTEAPRGAEVLVLGAGMAGLAAARALAERGVRVVVLEAQDRVGGRVLSQATPTGGAVELGAEFIHGRAPELWALIEEVGAETTERTGTFLREEGNGLLSEGGADAADDEVSASLDSLADLPEDQSFAAWLAGSSVPESDRASLTGYVEGFNAADANRISALALGVQQRAEEASGGDQAWHVHGGYAQLAEYLADRARSLGAEVQLGSEATAVRWDRGQVEVTLRSGETVRAPRCIVTLPLGVLQSGKVFFEPEPLALAPARRLVMGDATRFTLVFREPWWQRSTRAPAEELRRLHFLFTPGRKVPVWWTAHPEPEAQPTLTGWAGGPRAAELAGLLQPEGQHESAYALCADLAEVFGMAAELVQDALLSLHTHDWAADPFSLGSYSYVPVGGLEASATMARPEADTLFFAGEHTDTSGHWGTVHAAMRSGLRAAAQVLGEQA